MLRSAAGWTIFNTRRGDCLRQEQTHSHTVAILTLLPYPSALTAYPTIRDPLFHTGMRAYDPPMQVQLSHPARTIEVKGPKKVKELLRELNLVVEAHLVIKGDDLVTEDEMLYDGDQIEIRPVISGG